MLNYQRVEITSNYVILLHFYSRMKQKDAYLVIYNY